MLEDHSKVDAKREEKISFTSYHIDQISIYLHGSLKYKKKEINNI